MIGPNYSLMLNRHSQCRHLPSSNYLAMIFADPISNLLNAQLGEDLDTNTKQRSGVAYSRMFDGTTRIFLYSFTHRAMNKEKAQAYCSGLGLSLPTVQSLKQMTRIGLFTSVIHDMWLDGSDSQQEGLWISEVFKSNLNRLPWASRISGYTKREDCLKGRCDFSVNDWPCQAELPVVCVRERLVRIPIVTSIEFNPENWSRAVALGHCQPIRNKQKWMNPRCGKHVPGSSTCNTKYLHLVFKEETNKKTMAVSPSPNCIFFPPSAYSCKRWTQQTLREDLLKARQATQKTR